ncbi:LOW QUALITY PROTEIN: coiled-coil alpha-helical rod protein 1 [Pholidichthys leucotaenia]
MKRNNLGKKRLIVPTDFISPPVCGTLQEDLIPPSHFTSSIQSTVAHRSLQIPATPPPTFSFINPGAVPEASTDPSPASPWLALTRAHQEISQLKKENQRLMILQGDVPSQRTSIHHMSDLNESSKEPSEQQIRWESVWQLEVEKHKTKAEGLRGQVESLKEAAERCREEMRDKDHEIKRKGRELEVMHEELSKTKTELSRIREEVSLSRAQEEDISSQLEQLKAESVVEISQLRRDLEKNKEECQQLALKAEMDRREAEEEAKQQRLRLLQQLEEVQEKKEFELQQLNTSHCAELDEAQRTNGELQDRLQSVTSEVQQLKSSLMEVSAERNELKEHLSQMGQAFETQSATLHSLRNYIGQLAPEKGEKERLNETIERLTKEKAALQTTTELLTVRLNSVNEILALQEEKMVKKTLADPLVKSGYEGLQVLKLWREKVFTLCVQLRTKDIELREEKDKLISQVRSTEQHLQQEQHRVTVLQHTLHDKTAEHLERAEKEALKEDLAKIQMENAHMKSLSQKTEEELENLDRSIKKVHTCSIRHLTSSSLGSLQLELSVVCEERDQLTQELKRTPELIDRALADLKEQYENKVKQQQLELEHSHVEVQQAAAGRKNAEQSLLQVQAQLEESKVNQEKLRCELLSLQEHSEQVLQKKVSEIEEQCAERLKEMEVQISTTRREHTRAVMTLRQFEKEKSEKEVTRKLEEMKETHLESQFTTRKVQHKQVKEMEKDNIQLPVTGLMRECTIIHPATLQKSAAPCEHQLNSTERSCSAVSEVQLPANERLLRALEELHTLSAAVVDSSEDSAEDEESSSSARPFPGSLYS